MAQSRSKILQLYKTLLKESSKFEAYNYRMYALRKIRDAFKENKSISDVEQIDKFVEKAQDNLDIIKRQVLLSKLYSTDKLVIEKQDSHSM